MEIGEMIKKRREKLGFSQRQLAYLSGVSNTEIKRIEDGDRKQPLEYTVEHFRGYLNHIGKTLDAKLDPYDAKKIIDTYVEKIILYPDNRVEVILKFNIPTDPNGSNGKKSREYNVGAEGGNLTYTHRFRLA